MNDHELDLILDAIGEDRTQVAASASLRARVREISRQASQRRRWWLPVGSGWRGQSLFSAARFAAAAAIVALFGGLLLAGVATRPSDEVVPASVRETQPPSPPRTIIVDPAGDGDVATLGAGIDAANDGDTVLVRPGTYAERLTVSADISVQGDGTAGDIVIAGDGSPGPLLSLVDSAATISSLSFTGEQGQVVISAGAPTLEGLTFDSVGSPTTVDPETSGPLPGIDALVIDSGSLARIADNTFSGGGGILVEGGASPSIEGNHLMNGPSIALVDVGEGTVVRGNAIEGASYNGIDATSPGSYLIEANDISMTRRMGISIRGEDGVATTPQIRHNIAGNGNTGIEVISADPDVIENITWNDLVGVRLESSNARVEGNVMFDNVGIFVGDWKQPDVSLGAVTPQLLDNKISAIEHSIGVGRDAAPTIAGNTFCQQTAAESGQATVTVVDPILAYEGANPTTGDNATFGPDDACPIGNLNPLTYGARGRQQVFEEQFGSPQIPDP